MAHEIKLTGTVLKMKAKKDKNGNPWLSLFVKSDIFASINFRNDMAIAIYDNVGEGEVIEVQGTLESKNGHPEIFMNDKGEPITGYKINAEWLKASGTLVKPVRVSKRENPFQSKGDLINDDPFS